MVDACGLLQSVAPDYGATLHAVPEGAQAVMTVKRPGGSKHTFRLALSFVAEHVSVRELPGHTMLPTFCPDRHINGDGSFCLGWGGDNPSTIADEATARRWWAAVYQFLARQAGANARGVFPGTDHGRAHGDAAVHQAKAEQAAAQLGPAFAERAADGKFVVRPDPRPGQHRLELWCGTERLARVSTRSKVLVGGRTICPCGETPERDVTACGDHSQALATFILEHHACKVADKSYLDACAAAGYACCDTLQTCGLRQAIKRKQTAALAKGKSHGRRSKYWMPPAKSKRPR
ncbi:E2 domain-containing protein [uncultured Pseudoxanthomonas sp.]|uniref:E2 domain-containing protein n=1 Tax=uncultured Pseudoxanthomonas sp. TaxID=281701 RepID=UPI00261945E7|nr:E2 domain-containing protein [uncultured Pseudoxanthomonas sp.]